MADRTESPRPVHPQPIEVGMSVSALVEGTFLSGTAGRLAAGTRALITEILGAHDALVGLSIDATLATGGGTIAALVPLIEGGYIDFLAITGTNLYYDALFAIGKSLAQADAEVDAECEDCGGGIVLRRSERASGEALLREMLSAPDFQQTMGTAGFHSRLGRHLRGKEKELGVAHPSLLTTAQDLAVPIFNPAPADNPLGSLVASLTEEGNRLAIDTNRDLNEAAAIVHAAGQAGHACGLCCFGRGSAASFMLGIPAHIGRILGPDKQTDYRLQLRMAGRAHEPPAPPIDAAPASEQIFTVSTDLSVALPLLAAHIIDRVPPRPLKRLGKRREDLIDLLRQDRLKATLKSREPKSALPRGDVAL